MISKDIQCSNSVVTLLQLSRYVNAIRNIKLSNGHSPQIRRNGELLVRMRVTVWRMLANVSSVECIESGEKGWRMSAQVR